MLFEDFLLVSRLLEASMRLQQSNRTTLLRLSQPTTESDSKQRAL